MLAHLTPNQSVVLHFAVESKIHIQSLVSG